MHHLGLEQKPLMAQAMDASYAAYNASNEQRYNLSTHSRLGRWRLDAAMMDSYHPADPAFNISLKTALGPVAFVGMGEPEILVADVMCRPGKLHSDGTSNDLRLRQSLIPLVETWTGDGTPETAVPDFYKTFVRDWIMYAAVGSIFA